MSIPVYQPFKDFDFKYKKCFLTGEITSPLAEINILPQWLLDAAALSGKEQMKLLDERIMAYEDLKVPCAVHIQENYLFPLESRISAAFEAGYAGISALSQTDLFYWTGKFMYSLVYIEMNGAIRQNQITEDGLNMGQGLMHRFGNLHTMIQGIYREVVFERFTPWTFIICRLEDANTAFSFRDELNTLTFSLKFKDFGIIACLQDNGVNANYHAALLSEIKGQALSGQQFEELCARFYYSNYLFNRLPEYNIMPVENTLYIESMPLRGTLNKPVFDPWQHKTYGQVLENFWKPWNHTLFEIIKDPAQPKSYFPNPALPG